MNNFENLQKLMNAMNEMEELKKETINSEIQQDLKQVRIEALLKIQQWFRELTEVTKGFNWSVEYIPITIYWLVPEKDLIENKYRGLTVRVSKEGYVDFDQSSGVSHLTILNFTNIKEEDFTRPYGDSYIFNDGFLSLISKWDQIKAYVEKGAESAIINHMGEVAASVINFKNNYQKAVDVVEGK